MVIIPEIIIPNDFYSSGGGGGYSSAEGGYLSGLGGTGGQGGVGSWAGCYNKDGSPYTFDPYNGPTFGKPIKENNHVGYMFED